MKAALAARVRTARLAADLTIAELSRMSGVSVRSIGDIERGVTTSPQKATVEAISAVLQLSEPDREVLSGGASSSRRPRSVAAMTKGLADATPRELVGRDGERARLRAILQGGDTANSVIVFGAAGVGKSALVADAVITFGQSPAVLVDFSSGTAPPTPIGAMQRMLAASSISDWRELTNFEQAVRVWRTFGAPGHPIVILDTLLDEAIARMLLSVGGFSTLIITSRPPLAGLSGVDRLRVPPLTAAEATRLLQLRTPWLRPDEYQEVAELCERLPLALDLIASRLGAGSKDSARRLLRGLRSRERRLDVLRFGGRSVRGALQISYDTLKSETARVFDLLSINAPSTFTVADVLALAGVGDRDADGNLDALVDAGLLETQPGGRFRMPELVRLFGESNGRAHLRPRVDGSG